MVIYNFHKMQIKSFKPRNRKRWIIYWYCLVWWSRIYHVLSPHKVSNVETERPLYDQIVQQEIIELHKLQTLIESKGGKVTDLNTDAIKCTFEDNKFPFELSDGKILMVIIGMMRKLY